MATRQFSSDYWDIHLPGIKSLASEAKLHLILSLVIYLGVSIRTLLCFIFESRIQTVRDRASRFLGYTPSNEDPKIQFPPSHIFSLWIERCNSSAQHNQMHKMIAPLAHAAVLESDRIITDPLLQIRLKDLTMAGIRELLQLRILAEKYKGRSCLLPEMRTFGVILIDEDRVYALFASLVDLVHEFQWSGAFNNSAFSGQIKMTTFFFPPKTKNAIKASENSANQVDLPEGRNESQGQQSNQPRRDFGVSEFRGRGALQPGRTFRVSVTGCSWRASAALPARSLVTCRGLLVQKYRPDCGKELKPGPGGLMNHLGKTECVELKQKHDTAPRPNGSITSFFRKKVAAVPATVRAPSLIQNTLKDVRKSPTAITGKTSAVLALTLSSSTSNTSPSALTRSPSAASNPAASKPSPSLRLVELIGRLRAETRRLPIAIPEADETNPLAIFAGSPASYGVCAIFVTLLLHVALGNFATLMGIGEKKFNGEELWEILAPTFHKAFSYGTGPETRERMIQAGPYGLGGFCRFLEYFVVERGLQRGMAELKVGQLLEATQTVLKNSAVVDPGPEVLQLNPSFIEIDSDTEEPIPIPTIAEIPRDPSEKSVKCVGFIYQFGTNYPLGLHDTMSMPWGYSYTNGVLTLQSHGCNEIAVKGMSNCRPCAGLADETMINGILNRAEHGRDERMNYKYYSFAGLVELLGHKNQRIQELRLRGLNTTRQLLSQAKSLSDYKRLARAIGSGMAKNVDRLDYTKEDNMRGILMWKMGGNRLADIAYRALGLPSRTTLRDRVIVPPIVPSPGVPQASEIVQNVEACFKSITDVRAAKKVVHQIIMFDELATEKRMSQRIGTDCRLGWDPNWFEATDQLLVTGPETFKASQCVCRLETAWQGFAEPCGAGWSANPVAGARDITLFMPSENFLYVKSSPHLERLKTQGLAWQRLNAVHLSVASRLNIMTLERLRARGSKTQPIFPCAMPPSQEKLTALKKKLKMLASQIPVGRIVTQIESAVKDMYKSPPMLEDAQLIGDESQDSGSSNAQIQSIESETQIVNINSTKD
ncbi:hypothetical protein C8R44DRAFT_748067 [Mycena epipterygia]|nr:hypothetical protein C8R44DRAFT_748067 [Mycena epipterygia]